MLRELFAQLTGTSTVSLTRVNLGPTTVEIPVADIHGKHPGPTLLVTGGMDGDEYAGIEAAYRLIDRYKSGDFAGRLIIIPILNIPGFAAESSKNPLDNTFPKYFFPGRKDGQPTERLIHWLASTYALNATCWIDLHGGAITEGLQPFLWFSRTGNATVDALTDAVCATADSPLALMERAGNKAARLAKHGCTYILAESGARGCVEEIDVARHLQTVEATMGAMRMLPDLGGNPCTTILRSVEFVHAPFDGLWHAEPMTSLVTANQLLGTARHLTGSGNRTITAPCNGVPLWWKETLRILKGDILCAIGKQ